MKNIITPLFNARNWFLKSLKRFFIVSLFCLLGLSIIITILITRHVTVKQVDELYDAQMAQTSRVLQSFLNRPIDELDYDNLNSTLLTALNNFTDDNDDQRHTTGHGYENKLAVQLWDEEGNLLVKTPTAPMYLLSPLEKGYSIAHYQQHNWHTFTQYMPQNQLWIVLAEREDIRDELIQQSLISALGGLLVAAVFMSLCLIWVIKRGLNPLNTISQQLEERDLDKLASISLESSTPKELIPVVSSINQLMNRVASAVEIERRFLGDVAHELRTPLSALKLNTQIGLQSVTLEQSKTQLSKILNGINRSNRLIQQLLTLARLDPKALGEKIRLNLFDLLTQSIQDLDNQAVLVDTQSHSIQLQNHYIQFDDQFKNADIFAYPLLMTVLFRNLIDNACRYSPKESTVTLKVQQDKNFMRISVVDNGPGIAREKLGSLGKRFFRADTDQKAADQSGSGLGLSIVARIIELHQGQLEFFAAQPQGLEVRLSLPS
jgi:two-component system, OmpR family, sensor histidine kinase QseC